MDRTLTLDDSTHATDPGLIQLSHQQLRRLRPGLYGIAGAIKAWLGSRKWIFPERVYLTEQLQHGDSRAAVCVSVDPLLIAAYTDELDCVALLRFPGYLAEEHALVLGSRLLTVNCYAKGDNVAPDLSVGPGNLGQWINFHPIIANFVTDDRDRVQTRMAGIAEAEWQRAMKLGREYLRQHPGRARDGRPGRSQLPAV